MLEWLLGLDQRRKLLLRRARPGPLRDYLSAPFADGRTDYCQVEFVALDLETTGLDAAQGAIVSIGLVRRRGERVDLATAQHHLVRQTAAMPESAAVIHRITDDRAAQGQSLAEVLPDVLATLKGRVMIAHHARIELGFLHAACCRLYGAGFIVPTVDTEALVRNWLDQRNEPYGPGDLRLSALRRRYGLPAYRAHDALSDALGAAELFIAHLSHRRPGPRAPLKHFLASI
jgi:DNA polymerase III subunit epsilon